MSTDSTRHTANSAHTLHSTGGVSKGIDGNDEGKPALPYTLGTTFTAYRHVPTPPFGHGYTTPWPPFKSEDFRRLTQLDYCLTRQPMDGHSLDESRTLTITGLIRTGFSCGAQIVVVNEDIVAKIYDPLYDKGMDCYDNKRDVVVLADGDYTREAAAYQALQHSLEARDVKPEYHGSWTINVQTTVNEKTYTRRVRLLLMEHVAGTVMSSISPEHLPQQTRSSILQKILEAETVLYHAGVHHRDISPRNIIVLSPSPYFDTQLVIIDFNVSNVLQLSTRCHGNLHLAQVEKKWPSKMMGLITRFWDGLQEFEVRGWVGDGVGEANEWLWGTFGGSEKYVELVRDEKRLDECPKVVGHVEEGEEREVEGVAENIGVDDYGEEDVVVFKDRGL
jgi:hypothetical protein